jgi:copper chaperone CopZ
VATLSVRCPDITCAGCADAIKRLLGRAEGVQTIEVDVEQKQVSVEYDSARSDASSLRERLTRAGFPPGE